MTSTEIKAELYDGLDSLHETSPSDNGSLPANSGANEPNGDEVDVLQDALSNLSLKSGAYHGRSSGVSLFLQAAELKKSIGGGAASLPFPLKPMFDYPVSLPIRSHARTHAFSGS